MESWWQTPGFGFPSISGTCYCSFPIKCRSANITGSSAAGWVRWGSRGSAAWVDCGAAKRFSGRGFPYWGVRELENQLAGLVSRKCSCSLSSLRRRLLCPEGFGVPGGTLLCRWEELMGDGCRYWRIIAGIQDLFQDLMVTLWLLCSLQKPWLDERRISMAVTRTDDQCPSSRCWCLAKDT